MFIFNPLRFEANEGFAGDWSPDSEPPAQREMPVQDEAAEEQPAAAGIDYSDPAFLEAVHEATQHNIGKLLEQAAQYEEQAADPDVDPDELIDPEVRQYLEGLIQRQVQGAIQPMQPTVQAFEDQQNIQRIEEWTQSEPAIAEAQQMLGESEDAPSAANAVQFMATGYLMDLEERYGPGERATRTAIRMAADQLRSTVKAAHDAGYQARNAELQGHVQTRPPVPGGPVEAVTLAEQPADEMEAMEVIMARNGRV